MVRKKQVPRGSTSHNHRQMQIRLNNQENDEEGDRISDLPESLLSNILSRLPTKDAVRTSVLAKTWEYKWTCISNLEFDDRLFYSNRQSRKDHFSNFIDRVLMHGGGSSIQSFILRCYSAYELSRLHAWITAAVRRNVQRLEIDIWSASLVLPRCLHHSNSLRELKLLTPVTLRVPSDTLFSKLRKIDFDHVILRNQDLTNGLILLKFPFLESLAMYCCKWKNVKTVKMDAPLLTSFKMTHASYESPSRVDGFVFDIAASNLADFKLNGTLLENYVLPRPSPVENATIKLFFTSEWIPCGIRAARSLKQMDALKYLELSGEALIALNYAAEIDSLPLFGKLIHLKVDTYDSRMDVTALIRLLHRAPVLQMLTMDMSNTVWNDLQYNENQGDPVPACFSSHLKVVKFLYASASLRKEEELGLMKFILKNATVLERMELTGLILMPWSQVQEQLLCFPRGSRVASVVFN